MENNNHSINKQAEDEKARKAQEKASKYLFPDEPPRFDRKVFDHLILHGLRNNASDITFQSGAQVFGDIYGILYPLTFRPLTVIEVGDLINYIYGDNATTQLMSGADIDCSHEVKEGRRKRYRFRVNATGCRVKAHHGIQITLRSIPVDPPYLKDQNLSPILTQAVMPFQGIVIVAGATGSGKSTLLSAIMREIIETRDGKILTYESPIEFVYDNVPNPGSLICQSDIPLNLPNFKAGVRNALRRKPTYILVGEARDAETIEAVIEAALTGHTVFSTVHSNGVIDTIRRMISTFPVAEHAGKLLDLVMLMRVIIWQSLLPNKAGKRSAVREWLVFNEEVRQKLLNSKIES